MILLLLVLSAAGLAQIATAITLIRAVFRRTAPADRATAGHVVVILSLRGDDPFLTQCLLALGDQDYPDYEIRIVVDSTDDPAWRSIERSGVQSLRHVRIEVLGEVPKSCGLKNAALLQVLASLDDTAGAIALVDADTVVHRSWLRELVSPLGHDDVEVTTGIRWYLPAHASLAALTRLVWNAAATSQMVGMQIPWGGSLAISRRALETLDLPSHWSRGLSEDTMLTKLLAQHSMQQQFVPSLIMVNREDCSMGELRRWMKRQLLVARLYHPSWPMTLAHAFLSAAAPLSCLIAAVVFFACGELLSAAIMLAAVLVFQTSMYVFLLFGLWLVDRRLELFRGEPREEHRGLTWQILLGLPAAMLCIQVLYPITVIATLRARSVDWRQMHYQIHPDGSVSHDGHRPFAGADSTSSLSSL